MNGATTIQERLKDLRLNKGLKLEELAEQTGISKSALGSYEKDDFKEINHGNLILLADFYGVSLDYLFCRTENMVEINTPLRELHLSDEMVALLKSGRINNRLLCELKIDSESEFSENIGIIGRQINDAVVSYNYAGAAVYGYASLFGGSDRGDRKSTRLNSSHRLESRMPSSA